MNASLTTSRCDAGYIISITDLAIEIVDLLTTQVVREVAPPDFKALVVDTDYFVATGDLTIAAPWVEPIGNSNYLCSSLAAPTVA